jgi:hypothetical protein
MSENNKCSDSDSNTLSQFNDLIQQSRDILVCDANCQAEKGRDNLRQKYLEAKNNYLTAPEQVENTYKNYYVYEKGELAYNEEYDKILAQRADVIIKQFSNNFQDNVNKSKILLESYTSVLVNFQHVSEYYKQISEKNALLKKKLYDLKADITTNDRKSYYEDQGIESLNFYYYILLGIYLLILVVFIACMFLKASDFSLGKRMVILIFMFLYLFIAFPTVTFFISLFKKIGEMIPKNVYNSI